MTVNHLVWIKFAPGVTPERINEHCRALESLRTEVPGILHLSVGPNFTDRAKGFTHGLTVTLRDKAALPDYANHPKHVSVATALRQDAELMALDYEF